MLTYPPIDTKQPQIPDLRICTLLRKYEFKVSMP